MARIIDKIQDRREKAKNYHKLSSSSSENKIPPGWYYSFEFFPPKTEAGLENLLTRIDRMAQRLEPLFMDVTWGSGGSTSARTMAVASHAQRYCGLDVLMHLTTTGMTRDQITFALEQAKSCGVHNLLILRGDPPRGKRSWNPGDVSGGACDRAIDLVRLVRVLHGDYFGIAIAGHPEGHPSSLSLEEEMNHLKAKVEAGADFILTQFFYNVQVFFQFVTTCRQYGIRCPILPGIMPIQSYTSLIRMTQYCSVSVPANILEQLEPVKFDDEAVKDIGCQIAVDMCTQILSNEDCDVDGVHFYTLNLERSVTRILMEMGAINLVTNQGLDDTGTTTTSADNNNDNKQEDTLQQQKQQQQQTTISSSSSPTMDSIRASAGRPLPWRPSAMAQRSKEEVRPINWANRPKSYVMRTEDWDEFPNGRWGDSTSPAFGELSDVSHFYSFSIGSEEDQRSMLGHNPTKPEDVFEVFAKYVEGHVPYIPWCENPLQPESFLIQKSLASLNRAGFLTINSQPSVNGAPSTHPTFGWGSPGGFIYQKAYCECFCSPDRAERLVELVERHESSMNLYAVNHAGEQKKVGLELGGVTALTWGAFPNREILQPTIFDPSTFLVWAEEAFSLWTTMWLHLYEFDSPSFELIENIRDTYFLVAIIDNNYISNTSSNDGEDTSNNNNNSIWSAILSVADD